MNELLEQFFDLEIMWEVLPLLLKGLLVTLQLCVVTIPIGLCTGLAVALASTSRSRWLRWPAIAFVDFFRAVPPLVVLIFAYSGLPFFGMRLTPFFAVCLALLLAMTSYFCEVLRAGLETVGKGQREAAASTGLGKVATLVYIVIPQAVRNVLPDLVSNMVEVVKLTSLASVVALPELLYNADMARAATYNATPMVAAALIYLAILWPVVRLLSRLENKATH
jgi:polar amino acid transport system permease protein